jgi:hypothetical protein
LNIRRSVVNGREADIRALARARRFVSPWPSLLPALFSFAGQVILTIIDPSNDTEKKESPARRRESN